MNHNSSVDGASFDFERNELVLLIGTHETRVNLDLIDRLRGKGEALGEIEIERNGQLLYFPLIGTEVHVSDLFMELDYKAGKTPKGMTLSEWMALPKKRWW